MATQHINSQGSSANNNAKSYQDNNVASFSQPVVPPSDQAQPTTFYATPSAPSFPATPLEQPHYTTPSVQLPSAVPTTYATSSSLPSASPYVTTQSSSTFPLSQPSNTSSTTAPFVHPSSSTLPQTTTTTQPGATHHLTAHQMHPTLPILPEIQNGVKLLRFYIVEATNEPAWTSVHHIYDASGNAVYEARGGGQNGAHTLLDTLGQVVVSASGSPSRVMLTVNTSSGTVSADYRKHLITQKKTLTMGGTKYVCNHDTIEGRRGHSWSLSRATEPIVIEEGSKFHNEWHLHVFPACSEALEKVLVMVALFERHAVV